MSEKKHNNSSSEKLGYLQLIQEPICRMSTISAIFKGFAATVVAGISMIAYSYTPNMRNEERGELLEGWKKAVSKTREN